jgi:hypothetical protein
MMRGRVYLNYTYTNYIILNEVVESELLSVYSDRLVNFESYSNNFKKQDEDELFVSPTYLN